MGKLMNVFVPQGQESSAGLRTRARRFRWLLAVGLMAVVGAAVSNPSEPAHRQALAGQTFCRYDNSLLFSTMTRIELSGEEHLVSTGFFGTVFASDEAPVR